MPDQTPEPPLQSDAALAELRARLATDGTLAPVPEELAPLCPVCLCGVVDDVADLDDGSLIHGECMPVDVMIGQINTERDESARLRARIAELEAEHDRVYRDRAEVVAVLATIFPSQMAEPADETGWPALYLDTPEGQLAWPINPADLDLFNTEAYALALDEDPDSAPVWDRHSNEQQSTRLHRLATCYQPADFLGTETGTRPAAPQPGPVGYAVVVETPSGDKFVQTAPLMDRVEAERRAAIYRDQKARVYALREVNADA